MISTGTPQGSNGDHCNSRHHSLATATSHRKREELSREPLGLNSFPRTPFIHSVAGNVQRKSRGTLPTQLVLCADTISGTTEQTAESHPEHFFITAAVRLTNMIIPFALRLYKHPYIFVYRIFWQLYLFYSLNAFYRCYLLMSSIFFHLDLFLLIHRSHFYIFNSWGTQIAMSPVYLCTNWCKERRMISEEKQR